jgi:hypothetical protein
LLDRYPHVLAYVAGHTHDNNVEAFTRTTGSVWWGIETSATADWPVQHRLIEVMDNEDGTLSIFGTLLDHAAGAAAPPAGNASGFDSAQLASIGREVAYNDPQAGDGTGEGNANDQNVELLLRDPRRGYPRPAAAVNFRVPLAIAYEQCGDNESPNRSHSGGLSGPSCNPATQTSATATVGTGDANGNTPKNAGSARFGVICNPPAPNPSPPCFDSGDQADVRVTVSSTDVRTKGTLADYESTLTLRTTVTITDRHNTSSGGASGVPATVVPRTITVPVPCEPTPDTTVGSTCQVSTTLDTLTPGTVIESARGNWELGRVELLDQSTVFATQGIFVP